jgi:hypothetical protein
MSESLILMVLATTFNLAGMQSGPGCEWHSGLWSLFLLYRVGGNVRPSILGDFAFGMNELPYFLAMGLPGGALPGPIWRYMP